jgi:helicase MOV-10
MICHENNAHFPFRASRLVFLKTNLAKCYNQLLGMNSRDIGNELVWPNKDWADSALSPETRRYSLYDELLLAGPQAHKFARQKQDVITRHHYLRHWWVLLNIEENRHVGDLKSLDVHNTSFRMNTRYPGEKVRVAVNIPGVDEKRPNLTYGMAINLRVTKNDNGKSSTFEMMGYVADRRGTNVQIDLSSRSMMECAAATGAASLEAFLTQTIFHLRFTHQKDYFQAMRLALLFLHTDHRTLFPTRNSLKRSANKRSNAIVDAVVNKLTDSAAWVDNQVNGEQRVAVGTILSGECGFAPIVIHGPPGTGKTKTVVEAVNQIVRADFALNAYAHRKILLTAPSDIACDIICSRLSASLGTNEMHRMNLPQRKVNEVVEMAILPYCNLGQTGEFQLSDIDSLKSYRVIVCTCAASALLLGYLPESAEPWGSSELSDQPLSRISIANHFQYIFIDEAGQALEPEVLIPITVGRIGGSNATVVMSGDPNQLEASVRSPVANSFGFGTSCMERLMKLPLYSPSAGKSTSPFVFVRLMENYRSHVDILKFSARVFYEDRMVARCELSKANQFLNWGPIPRKASGQPFPLVLHSVEGSEVLDMGSTSLYNFEEANAVVEIIEGLLAATEIKCNTGMISVLAAYWQQVRLIRKQLRKKELGNVRVGVVDDYQGQEAPITILSCVLTHPQQQISENVSPLTGLLGCPKRTNVALTRAMGLSIVVASPEFLRNDVYFARLAKYCLLNNALIGKSPFSPDSANGAEDMKSSESPEDSNLLTAWNFMEHYATMSLKSMRLFSESNTSGADVTSVDAFYKEDTPFFGNSL